jgi:hypothetical protein
VLARLAGGGGGGSGGGNGGGEEFPQGRSRIVRLNTISPSVSSYPLARFARDRDVESSIRRPTLGKNLFRLRLQNLFPGVIPQTVLRVRARVYNGVQV